MIREPRNVSPYYSIEVSEIQAELTNLLTLPNLVKIKYTLIVLKLNFLNFILHQNTSTPN